MRGHLIIWWFSSSLTRDALLSRPICLETIYLLLPILWSPHQGATRPMKIFSQRSLAVRRQPPPLLMPRHQILLLPNHTRLPPQISSASSTHPPPSASPQAPQAPPTSATSLFDLSSPVTPRSTPAQTSHTKYTVIRRVQQERCCHLTHTTTLDNSTGRGGYSCSVPGKGEHHRHRPELPSSCAQGKQAIAQSYLRLRT